LDRQATATQFGPNIGYWIGEPYWGNGYMTESARGFIRFVFDTCDCDAVFRAFAENIACSRRPSQFCADGDATSTPLTRAAWGGRMCSSTRLFTSARRRRRGRGVVPAREIHRVRRRTQTVARR
jgi:hypothetical protein